MINENCSGFRQNTFVQAAGHRRKWFAGNRSRLCGHPGARNSQHPVSAGRSLELLNSVGIDQTSARQVRGVIGRQVLQLQRLVNDLLDAYRTQHQQIRIIPSLTDLPTALEAICQDHYRVFASRGISLTLDVTKRPLWLNIDVDRLDQAWSNLLSNRLTFTDAPLSLWLIPALWH